VLGPWYSGVNPFAQRL